MFSWCFKCQTADDDNEYHQRPKTRNSSITKTTTIDKPQQNSHTAVTTTDDGGDVNVAEKSVEQMQKECLEAHNRYRTKHGVSPLTLSKQLNAYATEWAKQLANSNTLQHRKNNKYGENLYLGTGMGPQTHELAVQAWYDEIKNYNFNKPGFSSNTGHFTQVVWTASKELGVGIVKRGNRTWVVCNYDPPGNVMGNYMDCVPPLVEQKVAKIIDKMKPQKLKRPLKAETIKDKDETDKPAPSYSAKDLKLWSKFELECLDSHNRYRAIHGSPAMKLNRKLCNLAQDWSKHLAIKRALAHRPNNEYGENVYYAMNFDPSAEQCVKSWYDEIKDYNYSKPGFSMKTGHFTQVVWKDSIELGVGVTTLNNMTFVVCNYSPAGNVMNQYKEQVPKAGSKPMKAASKPVTSSKTKESNSSIVKQPKIEEPQTFEEVCLESHNSFRTVHGSPEMSINKNLNFFASDWANHLARINKLEYRKNNRYGENIFYTTVGKIEGHEPVQHWYQEILDYNFQRPGLSPITASFTQLIWKSSKQLGVGKAQIGHCTYVVCNYDPKGNIEDKFTENVFPVGGEISTRIVNFQNPLEENDFAVNLLKFHNKYRLIHGGPPLELNPELKDYAQKYADKIIENKSFTEIPLYSVHIINFENSLPSPEEIVSNWYNEKEHYDFQNPQNVSDVRHFTQIIWKNTKYIGVGISQSKQNYIIVVCYEPAGNIEHQYAENVLPPI